jgi:nitrogen fixation/metabolism regulation signal transduction histidine kinase
MKLRYYLLMAYLGITISLLILGYVVASAHNIANLEIVKSYHPESEKIMEMQKDISLNMTYLYLLFFFSSILVSSILTLLLTKKIIGPIKNMTILLDELSKGNFKVNIEGKSDIEELEDFKISFKKILNSMKLSALFVEEKEKELENTLKIEKSSIKTSLFKNDIKNN